MTDDGITAAEVELVLRKALQTDLTVLDYRLQTFSSKVGFLGDHNTLVVRFCDANGRNGEQSFFLKLLPKGERYRQVVLKNGLFTKEKEMYEKLLPLTAKALGRRMPAADCYLIRDDGYVILEDLSRMGYKLWDKYAFLGRRQAEAALEAVAALHAGSLAVEVSSGAMIPRHASHCTAALIADSSSDNIVFRQWHFSSLKTCFSLLQKMQCYKSRVADADWDAVFDALSTAWDQSALGSQGFSAKFRNVLSHGDLWVNNMLFKDESDGVKAVLVDFQTYRYAPPALDVLMLLHCTTSREFRAQHQEELIKFYFEELENLLRAAGVDNPIDMEQLQESVKEFELVAAVLAARHIPTILKQGLTDATVLSTNYTAETATKESAFDQSDLLLGIFGGSELGKRFEERMKDTLDALIEVLALGDSFNSTSQTALEKKSN